MKNRRVMSLHARPRAAVRTMTNEAWAARVPWWLVVCGALLILTATLVVQGQGRSGGRAAPQADRPAPPLAPQPGDGPVKVLEGIPVTIDVMSTLSTSVAAGGPTPGTPNAGTRGTEPCPQESETHSSANFGGGQFVIQAGFVAGEIAAASYTLDPEAFPVVLNAAEMIFAQNSTTVTTTTQWSFMVWEGTPDSGAPIITFSSQDALLPELTIPIGSNGVNANVVGDPNDPIVIQNDGSNTFTVGYRIDAHNAPPTADCNFGLTPAACCPPSTSANAFPTTDTMPPAAPTHPSMNWLYCRPGCGFGSCEGGWHPFSELGPFRPSGDWNIRVTFTAFDCPEEIGACCYVDGSCLTQLNTNCATAGGIFQGGNTTCVSTMCPEPVGACCFYDTSECQSARTATECATEGGVWLGPGSGCTFPNICDPPVGACCFAGGACANLTEADCGTAGGTWGGDDTECATFVCNPMGACCLPSGVCSDSGGEGLSPSACEAMGGVFQGHATTCATVSCPVPLGACCLSNGSCLTNQTESNCGNIPGANWAGPGTGCPDGCEVMNCPSDLAQDDGVTNVFDLLELLANWGTDGPGAGLAEPNDLVNVFDLLELLGAWGPC